MTKPTAQSNPDKKRRKTATKTATPEVTSHVAPSKPRTARSPINGAEIPLGAHPGNTGGKPGRSGRLPSEVRRACLEAFDHRIPRLMQIADGAVAFTQECPKCGHKAETPPLPVTEVSDMRNAIDQLGKYGLGEKSEFSADVVTASVDKMLALAETLMRADDYSVYCRQVDAIWNAEAGR